jgi:hypothetical protein
MLRKLCTRTEADFLVLIGTKILRLFNPCYSQSLLLVDFTSTFGFVGLDI